MKINTICKLVCRYGAPANIKEMNEKDNTIGYIIDECGLIHSYDDDTTNYLIITKNGKTTFTVNCEPGEGCHANLDDIRNKIKEKGINDCSVYLEWFVLFGFADKNSDLSEYDNTKIIFGSDKWKNVENEKAFSCIIDPEQIDMNSRICNKYITTIDDVEFYTKKIFNNHMMLASLDAAKVSDNEVTYAVRFITLDNLDGSIKDNKYTSISDIAYMHTIKIPENLNEVDLDYFNVIKPAFDRFGIKDYFTINAGTEEETVKTRDSVIDFVKNVNLAAKELMESIISNGNDIDGNKNFNFNLIDFEVKNPYFITNYKYGVTRGIDNSVYNLDNIHFIYKDAKIFSKPSPEMLAKTKNAKNKVIKKTRYQRPNFANESAAEKSAIDDGDLPIFNDINEDDKECVNESLEETLKKIPHPEVIGVVFDPSVIKTKNYTVTTYLKDNNGNYFPFKSKPIVAPDKYNHLLAAYLSLMVVCQNIKVDDDIEKWVEEVSEDLKNRIIAGDPSIGINMNGNPKFITLDDKSTYKKNNKPNKPIKDKVKQPIDDIYAIHPIQDPQVAGTPGDSMSVEEFKKTFEKPVEKSTLDIRLIDEETTEDKYPLASDSEDAGIAYAPTQEVSDSAVQEDSIPEESNLDDKDKYPLASDELNENL